MERQEENLSRVAQRIRNPNVGATNSSGFTGLPGGLKQGSGGSSYQGSFGFWWSTIDAGNSNGFSLELDGNNVYSTIY